MAAKFIFFYLTILIKQVWPDKATLRCLIKEGGGERLLIFPICPSLRALFRPPSPVINFLKIVQSPSPSVIIGISRNLSDLFRILMKPLNPFFTHFFTIALQGGHIVPYPSPFKIELISLLKTVSYIFSWLLASNDQFPINFMRSSFLNLKNEKLWKI